jgi:hypothetical protein
MAKQMGVASAVFVQPNLATAVVPITSERNITSMPVTPDSIDMPFMVDFNQYKFSMFL